MNGPTLPAPPRGDIVPINARRAPVHRGPSLWGAIAVLAAWLIGARVARRLIGPYPPHGATTFFLFGWIPLVLLAVIAARRWHGARGWVGGATLAVIAVLVPCLAASAIPRVQQLAHTPVPGRPTMIAAAAPDGNADLYLVADGGARITRLTSTPETERMPDLSPDDRRIVYVSDRYGSEDLFLMELDDAGLPIGTTRLTSDRGDESEPHWSPDGHRIVFTVSTPAGTDLAVMDPDGSRRVPLTDDHVSVNPAWSPDGARLSFTRPKIDDPSDLDIWIMDADGAHAHDVVDAAGPQYGATWSPDAAWLAFTGITGSNDVFVARVDGSSIADLTLGSPDADEAYGWSPTGAVLFLSDRSHTGGTFLYFMDRDGANVHLSVIL